MHTWMNVVASVSLVSLLSLSGVFFLAFRQDELHKALTFLVSFAIGGLLGGALLHLIPEAYAATPNHRLVSLAIIAGFLLFFVLDKWIHHHHSHNHDAPPAHDLSHHAAQHAAGPVPAGHKHGDAGLVWMNFAGDGAHNFTDGMVIAASYLVGAPVGLAATIAVACHEIPRELGSFGIFLQGGLSIKKALLFNFSSALMALGGALITLLVGTRFNAVALALTPLTAGGFIYLAAAVLIPQLQGSKGLTFLGQLLSIMAGVTVMLLLVESH